MKCYKTLLDFAAIPSGSFLYPSDKNTIPNFYWCENLLGQIIHFDPCLVKNDVSKFLETETPDPIVQGIIADSKLELPSNVRGKIAAILRKNFAQKESLFELAQWMWDNYCEDED